MTFYLTDLQEKQPVNSSLQGLVLQDKGLIWRAHHVFVVGKLLSKARASVISCVFVYLAQISEREGAELKGITCNMFLFVQHSS